MKPFNREAYCLKKMKEKGIPGDVDELRRSANLPSIGGSKVKFNAFREMKEAAQKSNTSPGSAPKNDEQTKPQKIQIPYGSEKIEVNADGTVSPENIKFPSQSIIEISGVGDGTKSFAEIKVGRGIVHCLAPSFIFLRPLMSLERAEAHIRPFSLHYL